MAAELGPFTIAVRPRGPFDLRLSLEAAASFFPNAGPAPAVLRMPVEIEGDAAIVEIRQRSKSAGLVRASSVPAISEHHLRIIVKRLISSDLDLRPFYAAVASHPLMGAVVASLPGLKPLRPATLFEMAVIAVTEQQLSMAAAFHIRARIVRRFGTPLGELRVFPSPQRIATAPVEELRRCGLSQRKAEYLKKLADRIAARAFDLEALWRADDGRVRDALLGNRGFGDWSVAYILNRGIGRPDCLPSGDVGLRRVIGHYLAVRRPGAAELEAAMAPFAPFRGLAAYYLAVHWRLRREPSVDPVPPRKAAKVTGANRAAPPT